MSTSRPRPGPIGIIDDDPSVREAFAALLEAFDFRVMSFASALELLQFERLCELRCLLVDVHMPEMTGLDLQQRLLRSGRRIPIIFMTSRPDACTRARALAAGACGFLTKPCRGEELVGHIRLALGPGPS